jgi:1-acyl-sn-glycerol-3-phosphate acyltransferase
MLFHSPLQLSRWFLAATATDLNVHYPERIPSSSGFLVVSNHRSFMDALVLMAAIRRSIHFVCHHFMTQVPGLRTMVKALNGLPLVNSPQGRSHRFFSQAIQQLQAQAAIGIFPEGAWPMVNLTPSRQVGQFSPGFAHLALRVPMDNLILLPVAIASEREWMAYPFPVKTLKVFDPSEPLFDRDGWHPMVCYRQVNVLLGRPYAIGQHQRSVYRSTEYKSVLNHLVNYCHQEISDLLNGRSTVLPD